MRNGTEVWAGEIRVWDSSSSNSTPLSGTGNSHGRKASGPSVGDWHIGDIIMTSYFGSTVTLEYTGSETLRSPYKGDQINLVGKYNNIIRMRVKRTLDGDNWGGIIQWQGHNPIQKENGNYYHLKESSNRMRTISEPEGIDTDFVIIEWDMSGVGNSSGNWNDCIIEQISIHLFSGAGLSTVDVDWVEIGGLKADKYIDGTLRVPLRTESSSRRTRGTWAKIKYSAKTTDKFNIFAILAKYRKTY